MRKIWLITLTGSRQHGTDNWQWCATGRASPGKHRCVGNTLKRLAKPRQPHTERGQCTFYSKKTRLPVPSWQPHNVEKPVAHSPPPWGTWNIDIFSLRRCLIQTISVWDSNLTTARRAQAPPIGASYHLDGMNWAKNYLHYRKSLRSGKQGLPDMVFGCWA